MTVCKKVSCHIRWMIRRDTQEVLDVNQQWSTSWDEDKLVSYLRQRSCIGMVAEYNGEVVGFLCYTLHKNYLFVDKFLVHEDFIHRGVGDEMVDKLLGKINSHRRTRINAAIPETHLDILLLFQRRGFLAVEIKRNYFGDEDCIIMERHYHEE